MISYHFMRRAVAAGQAVTVDLYEVDAVPWKAGTAYVAMTHTPYKKTAHEGGKGGGGPKNRVIRRRLSADVRQQRGGTLLQIVRGKRARARASVANSRILSAGRAPLTNTRAYRSD